MVENSATTSLSPQQCCRALKSHASGRGSMKRESLGRAGYHTYLDRTLEGYSHNQEQKSSPRSRDEWGTSISLEGQWFTSLILRMLKAMSSKADAEVCANVFSLHQISDSEKKEASAVTPPSIAIPLNKCLKTFLPLSKNELRLVNTTHDYWYLTMSRTA